MKSTRSLLCATITAGTMPELRASAAACDADMVEVRLDGVERPDVEGAVRAARVPVIVTCRSRSEGGVFDGSETERHRLLAEAVRGDAAWVDLEWRSGFTDLVAVRRGRGIVLSHHDFGGVPHDLESRVAAMAATEAEVIKVAVKVDRLADCLALHQLSRRYAGRRLLLIGMGEAGLVTRVCAARFASPWTYTGGLAGPGQVSLERMRREFRFESVGADTSVYGLFGCPVSHSLSPALHNAALAVLELDAVYLPLAGADLDDCVRFAAGFGLMGASVTSPYKTSMVGRLGEVDDEARGLEAVNTIRRIPGGWAGTSTDGAGFLAGLGEISVAGLRATVLGSGGAARTVARALAGRGATVTVSGRDSGRARAAAEAAGVRSGVRPVLPGSWDLLVNATPVGTFPGVDESAFPEGVYDGAAVYDLVYNPPRTRFLREAEAQGCRVIGGLEMLIEQARRQVRWWTGVMPPAGPMREAAAWRLSTLSRAEQ